LDKFDSKSNFGIFLGYSSSSKAYRYNNRILCLEKTMHAIFKETQTDKIVEILLYDINESVQHLSLKIRPIFES
jgi:hypothetical protein